MKKKKKTTKKKIISTKLMIIIGSVLVIVLGTFILYKSNNNKNNYMNDVPREGCRPGEYIKTFFSSWCEPCEKGYYCLGKTEKPIACYPPSTTTRGRGAKTSKECNYCKEKGKTFDGTTCIDCPKGSYCDDGTAHKCDPGQTTNGPGKKSKEDCFNVVCSSKQQFVNDDGECEICPENHYCNGVIKTPCEDNRITSGKGQTSRNSCKCRPGTYDTGYFCIICPEGSYCNNGKENTCPEGYTSEQGKSANTDCYRTIAAGKSFVNNEIKKCGKGSYSEARTVYYGTDSRCTKCGIKTYQDETGQASCKACPEGYTSKEGATADTKCYRTIKDGRALISGKVYKCPKGSFSVKRNVYYGSDSKCTPCDPKTYQDETGQASCKACPEGYTSKSGATADTKCYRTIGAGRAFIKGTLYICSKGTYSLKRNVYYGSDSWCTACDPGTYQNEEGKSSCKQCSSGYSSKQGAWSCTRSSCSAGTYLDLSYSTGCRPCPSGKYCPGGTALPQKCKSGQKVNSSKSGCTNCSGIANCARYGGDGTSCKCTSCKSGYTINGKGTCTKVTKPCASRGTVGECNADGKCKWDYSYGCRSK